MPTVEAILIVDTREQLPYRFTGCASKHVAFEIVTAGLPEGDYAARLTDEDGAKTACLIERKSCGDLLGSVTHGRDRLERELERMTAYGHRAIVVEADLAGIVRGTSRHGSNVNPLAVVASLVAFSMRFGVQVWLASDRRHAEALVWRICERWCRDRADARREHRSIESQEHQESVACEA